jgi:hypothetical protein
LGLDKTETNDKLHPSDECPRDNETPPGLTAEDKCDFRGQHRNQENEREPVQALQNKKSRLSEPANRPYPKRLNFCKIMNQF